MTDSSRGPRKQEPSTVSDVNADGALCGRHAMTTAVEFLNRGHLDNAISWFQQAVTYGYPGAREVRNAVADLHDILQVTTTDRYRDDPVEQLILQPRLQASMNAVTHSLVRAARLALQQGPSATSEHTNTHPH